VRAHLRCHAEDPAADAGPLRAGDVTVDTAKRRAWRAARELALRPRSSSS
jgi:DNA-binding response OmpR family regulator